MSTQPKGPGPPWCFIIASATQAFTLTAELNWKKISAFLLRSAALWSPTGLLQNSQTEQFSPKCYGAHIGRQGCINGNDLSSPIDLLTSQYLAITTEEKQQSLWLSTGMARLNGFEMLTSGPGDPSDFFLQFVSPFCFLCLSKCFLLRVWSGGELCKI